MDDVIEIRMGPMHPGEDALKVYITPGFEGELAGLAEDEGLQTGQILEFSAGSELAILGIQGLAAVGGLAGFAAVLNAFFGKNKHKQITVTAGDRSVSVEGMSTAESQTAMAGLLDKVAEQQRTLDESWDRIRREGDEDVVDRPG